MRRNAPTMKRAIEEGGAAEAHFEACRLMTRTHAKTFYFASHVLPREKRLAAYAVYAFCRQADDIIDTAVQPGEEATAALRLQTLRDQVLSLTREGPQPGHGFDALRETVYRYRIPREYLLDLLRGVEMDLFRDRYNTFGELKDYCYCVASVVGLMMARVFGVTEDEALLHAGDLGTAMQLTNILRDIGEDYRMGRIYLPADELKDFGYTEEDLAASRINRNFIELMQFQIARARRFYAAAAPGIPMLPNDGSRLCVRLMSRTYEQILAAIEKNAYDVFSRRAFVPVASKALILLGAVAGIAGKPAASHPTGRSSTDEPLSGGFGVSPHMTKG